MNNTNTFGPYDFFGPQNYSVNYQNAPVQSFLKEFGMTGLGMLRSVGNFLSNSMGYIDDAANALGYTEQVQMDFIAFTQSTPILYDDLLAYAATSLNCVKNLTIVNQGAKVDEYADATKYFTSTKRTHVQQNWPTTQSEATAITESIRKANIDDVLRAAEPGEIFVPPEAAKPGAERMRILEVFANWPR